MFTILTDWRFDFHSNKIYGLTYYCIAWGTCTTILWREDPTTLPSYLHLYATFPHSYMHTREWLGPEWLESVWKMTQHARLDYWLIVECCIMRTMWESEWVSEWVKYRKIRSSSKDTKKIKRQKDKLKKKRKQVNVAERERPSSRAVPRPPPLTYQIQASGK
jgi:hypothetical protein